MQTPYTSARLKAVDPIVIKCGVPEGRHSVRQALRQPRNLGVIEGERLSHCHGYDESYGPVQMILSAMVVSLSVIGGLLIAYGLRAI